MLATAQDVRRRQWLRKAAEQNDAWAQNNLGDCYRDGNGVTVDYAEAAIWYRKAADQTHAYGQCNLGACYERGQGVQPDIVEAYKFYKLAGADQNHEKYHFSVATKESLKQIVTQMTATEIAEGERRYNEFLSFLSSKHLVK